MNDFSKEIQNFQRYGTYNYKFDSVGNLIFNLDSSNFSNVYLSFQLTNFDYNNVKIKSFYDPTFTEFVPPQKTESQTEMNNNIEEINTKITTLEEENVNLKTQLETLTNQTTTSETASDKLATKEVILELRKSLGQGRVDSDFSEDFPYAPIRKPQS